MKRQTLADEDFASLSRLEGRRLHAMLKTMLQVEQSQQTADILHRKCKGCGNGLLGPHHLRPFEEISGVWRTTGWRCGTVREAPHQDFWR